MKEKKPTTFIQVDREKLEKLRSILADDFEPRIKLPRDLDNSDIGEIFKLGYDARGEIMLNALRLLDEGILSPELNFDDEDENK